MLEEPPTNPQTLKPSNAVLRVHLSTKQRVDQALQTGAGIHPQPPGTIASVARLGTHGAPRASEKRSLDVRLSCACFSGASRSPRAFSRLQLPSSLVRMSP